MESLLGTLRECGFLDSGVLAAGVERGWVSSADVADYATERLSAGDDHSEVLELVAAQDLEPERVVELLRNWAQFERLPSHHLDSALQRWLFAVLTSISRSVSSPEEKLDRLEETYAMFGYPEEMRECSRYYVPPKDRDRGIGIGEITASPLEAMNNLLLQLRRQLGAK